MPEQMTPRTRDVEVNGITLHYVSWGEFTTPERTVVLIHGITSNSQAWNVLGPALAEAGWHAVAPDLRGRGLSAKPPHGYGIPYHVNDMLSLADALGLPRLNVVGHSLGAYITLFLAAAHADRVARIALVDGGGTIPADAYETVGASVQRIGTVFPSIDAFLDQQRGASVYTWNAYWENYYRYDMLVREDGTAMSRMPRHAYTEEVFVNAMLNTGALSDHVHAQTLILRATLGTIAPDRGFILPAAEAERLRAQIPGCRLVEVANTNHYIIILADDFVREVLAFLATA